MACSAPALLSVAAATAKVLASANAAAAKIWVTRMGTPEGGQGPEGVACGKNAATVRPLVQTAQAYHNTLAVKGSASTGRRNMKIIHPRG
ncbi:hypothetical protein PAGU2196_43930 [Pseudomonas sp. PAGU 2196]|nr:hypothetical protein PAGU2196_43930 [Pseudomonas sp. PAGU 2196]